MILYFISKVWSYITGFADVLFNIGKWGLDAVLYILLVLLLTEWVKTGGRSIQRPLFTMVESPFIP